MKGAGPVDVGALARQAVADGADLLGVAGGMGPRPWWRRWRPSRMCRCWSSRLGPGTISRWIWGWIGRNPWRCLDALTDGVELRVDLGVIAGRPFVNNAYLWGVCGDVQSPAYRDDKARTTLDQLPGLLAGQRGRG